MTFILPKAEVFAAVEQRLRAQGFHIESQDQSRPWGGFFVLSEDQAAAFAQQYFADQPVQALSQGGRLSPKVLVVAPQQRLSWQYHHRRAELWSVVEGPVGVVTSPTDAPGSLHRYEAGQQLTLQQGERHRLVGLENWGILAEIWQHTDAAQPSDEDDIVRVQDDFGR